MSGGPGVRDATAPDWPAIWRIVPEVVVAADTFTYDAAMTEDEARAMCRALVEDALRWAREAGFRAMQFNAVAATNTAAVSLYESLGFAIVGTVPEAFDHPERGFVGLHVMHRRLG